MAEIIILPDGTTYGGMNIHEAFRSLAEVIARKTPKEREQFKRAWLKSLPAFRTETERMRLERL
jgi:hypothetical protein